MHKVLILIDHLGAGGAQEVIHNLMLENENSQNAFEILPIFADNRDNPLVFKVKVLPPIVKGKYRLTPKLAAAFFKVNRYISKNNLDIVNSHLYVAWVFAAVLSVFRTRTQFVNTIHSTRRVTPYATYICILLSKFTKRLKFISLFDVSTTEMLAQGLSSERIATAQLALPSKDLHAIIDCKKDVKQRNDKFKILSVSRLHSQRRLANLLKAVSEINPQLLSNIEIHIFGKGPQEKFLHRLSSKLGLDEVVVFRGWGNISSIYSEKWNLGYSISTYNEPGLAAMQMLAAGIPVILWDLKSPRDYQIKTRRIDSRIHKVTTIEELKSQLIELYYSPSIENISVYDPWEDFSKSYFSYLLK